MEIVGFLIIFPIIAAAALFVVRAEAARTIIVAASAAIIMIASIVLAATHLFAPTALASMKQVGPYLNYVFLVVDILCSAYVIVRGVQTKRYLAPALAVVQLIIVLCLEFFVAHNVVITSYLYIDRLSVTMALIIGIVGSGICIYSIGYMRDFQKHEDEHGKPDRRHVFFALMFLFLSAMFLIIFANSLMWLFCGWEVTTVCSFALIGYTRTEEAVTNSFRQIIMNLIGGLAFAIALVALGTGLGTSVEPILEMNKLITLGAFGLFMIPIMLLALAGFTKAAQMPFQSWLLGAMVAPTPTSALLHSSTMVKAGAFLLIKLAPCFGFNSNGLMVVLVGGVTFLLCSAIAISQSNAKRVLAYSTVANLGLIVACAGVGTPEAVWAAIFLLIFHAVAKSLLFLCVGTAEHHIGSRDIEDMDAIFNKMPRLALLMALGMFCMFIAPFGMLIAKWATIVSIVQANNIALMLILAFGSALTFIFWAKWLGKTLAVAHSDENVEMTVSVSEWLSLGLMAVLVVLMSVLFPFISDMVVVPYLHSVRVEVLYGLIPSWYGAAATIDYENLLIMAAIVIVLLAAFVFQLASRSRKPQELNVYLSGVGLDFNKRTFRNSLSGETQATQRNWYLTSWFGEASVLPISNIVTTVILVIGLVLALVGIGGWL